MPTAYEAARLNLQLFDLILGTYALIAPFVAMIREATGNRTFLWHVEQLVRGLPEAEAILAQRRAGLRAGHRPTGGSTHQRYAPGGADEYDGARGP